jgi:hypothetical protein
MRDDERVAIIFRVPASFREQLHEAAARQFLGLSSYCRTVLAAQLRKDRQEQRADERR